MPLLPPRRSAVWLLVFPAATALLAAGLVWAGSASNGGAAPQDVVLAIVGISGAIAGTLTVLGAFGARATFAFAMIGLLVGLARMIWVAVHPHDGMADLAALANFFLFGAIGLGIGALIDFGRWLGSRQRRA